MPILRKIIKVGSSRAVVIPSEWLDYHREILGKELEEVGMEVDNVIIISPITERSKESPGVETVSSEEG